MFVSFSFTFLWCSCKLVCSLFGRKKTHNQPQVICSLMPLRYYLMKILNSIMIESLQNTRVYVCGATHTHIQRIFDFLQHQISNKMSSIRFFLRSEVHSNATFSLIAVGMSPIDRRQQSSEPLIVVCLVNIFTHTRYSVLNVGMIFFSLFFYSESITCRSNFNVSVLASFVRRAALIKAHYQFTDYI